MQKRNILILGSTGSIGVNALEVVARFPERFEVLGLTGFDRDDILLEQAERFSPRFVGVSSGKVKAVEARLFGKGIKVVNAETELEFLAALEDVDIVLIAITGRAALEPFLTAVRNGKTVAPANKEALVMIGDLIMEEAAKNGATVIPVDSEQSAIFQCLQGQDRDFLKKVFLTASGGALKDVDIEHFDGLSVARILDHPRWKMGKKITVDSATLMNKGFEVIEAMRLFGLRAEQVEVVVHPQAIIHSMVELCDGSVLAQLGITDMRIPIQFALTYPQRLESGLKELNFVELKELTFEKPDLKKFPSLALALDVARIGGTLPAVLNAADEVAVESFLNGRIRFTQVYDVVAEVVADHQSALYSTVEEVLQADQWARERAVEIIGQHVKV